MVLVDGAMAACWTEGSRVMAAAGGGWGHYVLWRRVCTICREEEERGEHSKLHCTRLPTLLSASIEMLCGAEYESQEAGLDF